MLSETDKIHRGFSIDGLKETIENSISSYEQITKNITKFMSINLSEEEKLAFAYEAMMAKFTRTPSRYTLELEEQLVPKYLETHRKQDEKDNLWTVFNVLQENIIKGGISKIITKNETVDSVDNEMFYSMPEVKSRLSKTKAIKDAYRKSYFNSKIIIMICDRNILHILFYDTN